MKDPAERVDEEKDVEGTDDDCSCPQEDAVDSAVDVRSHHAGVGRKHDLQDDRPRQLDR